MNSTTRRTILRTIHIAFALTFIGFIYGPAEEVEPYRSYFQYFFFPVVTVTGLLLWKGHLFNRLFRGRTEK